MPSGGAGRHRATTSRWRVPDGSHWWIALITTEESRGWMIDGAKNIGEYSATASDRGISWQ